MFELKEHEVPIKLNPVGIQYKCEICGEGYQVFDPTQPMVMTQPPMFPHKCTKCGKTMSFQRQYPYVAFLNTTEFNNLKNNLVEE